MKQSEIDFTHYQENSRENLHSYQQQKKRLNQNSEILLKCLQEGQRLTGLDVMRGVRHSGMTEVRVMTEFRKRFQEILKAGYPVKTERHSNGSKTWYMER